MEQLKIFNTEELYKNSYDSLRVNTVSKTIDNKKVWFKPRNKITAYYNVTNTSSATRILGADFDTSQIRYMVVDGVKVYPTYYDETEEQVIESYNMEEQSYTTMSLNLDDDDMDYRQHIASPNEGYGEIMTTMALNNDVETYAGNITPTPDYGSIDTSLSKYESKGTSYVDTTYKFDSNGEHIITFYFKEGTDNLSSCFSYCDNTILIDCESFDTSKIINMNRMFGWSHNIKEIKISNLNTSNVKDMNHMFNECSGLTSLNISSFDTSKVENMQAMLANLSLESIDINHFNTSNVNNIRNMFAYDTKLKTCNVENLNVENVENFQGVFKGCSVLNNLDVSKWNTTKGINMSEFFSGCTSLQYIDISNFDTSNVINMNNMFRDCVNLIEIKNFENMNISKVESMSYMFCNCPKLKYFNFKKLDFSNVRYLDGLIMGAFLNEDVIDFSDLDFSKVVNMHQFAAWYERTNKLISFKNSKLTKLTDPGRLIYFTNFQGMLDFEGTDLSNLTSLANMAMGSFITGVKMTSNIDKVYENYGYDCWAYTYSDRELPYFYGNPNNNYEFLWKEHYGHQGKDYLWVLKTIPTEVSFTIKLYDINTKTYITDKTLHLTQNVMEEVKYTYYDGLTFSENLSIDKSGNTYDAEGYEVSDFIPLENCLKLAFRCVDSFNNKVALVEYNENKEVIRWTEQTQSPCYVNLVNGIDTKYIRFSIKTESKNSVYISDETNGIYFFKGDNFYDYKTYSKIIGSNIITSTYNEELGGYNFNFIAYHNEYDIIDSNNNFLFTQKTYDKENIVLIGDVQNVNYDISYTIQTNNNVLKRLISNSSSKKIKDIDYIIIDNVQIQKAYNYRFLNQGEHIVKIKFKEKPTAYDLQYMFNGCSAMTSCDLSNLDTSEVTSMYGMFQGCTSLSSVTFGSNDTTNVTNIGNMFYNCSALTSVDFSTINMSNVDSMYSTFYNCSSLTSLDLTMFNNIVNINTLCYGCSKLTELKFNCDFSKVESYGNLLGNVTTNGVLYYNNSYESDNILYSLPSTWTFNPAQIINVSIELVENGSTVTNGSLHTITVADNTSTFNTETNLYDFNISVNSYNSASIKVDGVEQLNFVLVKGKTYKVFLGDTSSYDGFSIEMVYVPTTTTGPTQLFNSSFDLSQIYTMFIDGVMQTSVVSAYTFSDTNEHKVQCMTHDMTSMYYMFYNSNQLKSVKFGDSFNTSNVYTMYRTFRNCSNITEIDLSKLDLTNVETMNGLFHSCSNLKKVVLPENFGVNCVEMSYMFNYCYVLDDLNYENLNMSNCNTAVYMFCGTPFETFNASIFDMTNMINCEGMFSEMANLKSIDISGWNVKNGNSCGAILSNCTSLETVIMDNTYINARNLYAMFGNCTSLKEIDFNNSLGFYGDDFASFFYGCTNLKTIKGIDKLHPKAYTNYVFQNCESLTSIDLSSWDMSNVLRINDMFSNCKKLIDVTIYSSLDNVSDYANMFSGVTTDGVLNYNIIHEEKILDMFVTNQKVSNFPTSWRLNPVTLEKTYVLTLITNDAYVKNATVSLNNVVGVYDESDYTYTFENVQVTSIQLPLIVDGIEVSQVDESKLVQYVYYGTNDELYTLIDFTTPTFDTSVIIENDATYPWAYNEELGFLTSTMHEHNVVTYVTINSGIIGDATITLYQKNESESNYDYSAIFNSSNEIIYNLQNINSDNIVINVNTEDGILKFGYQKDYSYSEGTDCLGIKKIEGTKLPME